MSKNNRINKFSFIVLFMVLIVFMFSGCQGEETKKLIDSSVTAGKLLSEYYDKLINYTIETWELEAFISSLREVEFPIESQLEYETTISHLKKRKGMIDCYSRIFPLLDDFMKNNRSEEMKKTLTSLSDSINTLPPLKNNEVILPSGIFGSVGSDIIQIYQFFEIRYISKTLVLTLEKIKELFEKEKELYKAIVEERNNKSLTIINYLIDNEMLIPWALIESAPATVGLEFAVDNKPAKDDKTKKALKKVLEVKYYRFNYLIDSAFNELDFLLTSLISTYKEFISGKKVIVDNIFYIANRIGEYYNDIDNYYKTIIGNPSEPEQEEGIIYHGNKETKVFHSPDCQYYNSKNSTEIFNTSDEAINQGYSPCKACNP